jgi:hypothetical protein
MLISQAQSLAEKEPYKPKRDLLLPVTSLVLQPQQVVGLKQLLQPNSSLYYDHPDPSHVLEPINDLQRNYNYIDDWYFFAGVLTAIPSNKSAAPPQTFGFTVLFTMDSFGKSAGNAVESMYLLFTSVTDQKVFQSPVVTVWANSVLTQRAPFVFAPMNSGFALKSTGSILFPLQLHAEDPVNKIAMDLSMVSPFSESQPLFQGSKLGYIGGAGIGWLYYSYVNLKTTGSVLYAGTTYQVQGTTWMDHQLGNAGQIPSGFTRGLLGLSSLFGPPKKSIAGWIWISVMLGNNTSLAMATAIYHDANGNVIQDAETDTLYANIQESDGSSKPLPKLHLSLKYTGPYVTEAHIQGPNNQLNIVLSSMIPGKASAGINPNTTPFAETPSVASGTLYGKDVSGIGFLETVGAVKADTATKSLLALTKISTSPENIKILQDATWKVSQAAGWSLITTLGLIVLLLIWVFKKK